MYNLEKLSEIRTSKDILHKQYSKTGLYVMYPFLCLLLLLVLFLFFAKKEIVIEGIGSIDTSEIGTDIQVQTSSQITEIYAQNNAIVTQGDILLKLDSTLLENEIENTQNAIENQAYQIELLNLFQQSVVEGHGYLENDDFGYKSQFENYLTQVETLKISSSQNTTNNRNNQNSLAGQRNIINQQIAEENSFIQDYRIFRDVVNTNPATIPNTSTAIVATQINTYLHEINNIPTEEDAVPTSGNSIEQIKLTTLSSIEEKISAHQATILQLENSLVLINENLKNVDNTVATNDLSIEGLKLNILSSIEVSLADYNNAKEELELNLQAYETNLEKYTIRATADGKLEFENTLLTGTTLTEGTSLGKIINTENENLYVTAYVPSADILGVEKGQAVTFRVISSKNGKRQTYTGEITNIGTEPMTSEAGSYYIIECTLDSLTDLPYGVTGELYIITGKTTYLNYVWKLLFG